MEVPGRLPECAVCVWKLFPNSRSSDRFPPSWLSFLLVACMSHGTPGPRDPEQCALCPRATSPVTRACLGSRQHCEAAFKKQ